MRLEDRLWRALALGLAAVVLSGGGCGEKPTVPDVIRAHRFELVGDDAKAGPLGEWGIADGFVELSMRNPDTGVLAVTLTCSKDGTGLYLFYGENYVGAVTNSSTAGLDVGERAESGGRIRLVYRAEDGAVGLTAVGRDSQSASIVSSPTEGAGFSVGTHELDRVITSLMGLPNGNPILKLNGKNGESVAELFGFGPGVALHLSDENRKTRASLSYYYGLGARLALSDTNGHTRAELSLTEISPLSDAEAPSLTMYGPRENVIWQAPPRAKRK